MQINYEQVQKVRNILPSYQRLFDLSQTVENWENYLGANYLSDEQFLQSLISQSQSGCLSAVIGTAVFIITNVAGWLITRLMITILGSSGDSTPGTSYSTYTAILIIGGIVFFALSVFLTIIIPRKIQRSSFKGEVAKYRAMREDVNANREEYTKKLNNYKWQLQQLYNEILNSPDNIVPQDYWPRASYILNILELGRASDVGNAINIIITENQFRAMHQEIVYQGNQMQQMQQSVNKMQRQISSLYWRY